MTAATLEHTYSARQAATKAGVTYRQIDYWIRNGVTIGDGDNGGSGSRRSFTDGDVAVLRFVGRFTPIVGRPDSVMPVIRRVVARLAADPSILDRPLVFIGLDGTISEHPVHGWVVQP